MKLSKLLATGFAGIFAATVLAVPVVLTINTDDFGGETWFSMVDGAGTPLAYDNWTSTILSGPDAMLDDGFVEAGTCGFDTDLCTLDNDTLTFTWDLGPGDYVLTMFDEAGDGVCCDFGIGSYSLDVNGDVLVFDGGFADSESTAFSIAAVSEPGVLALFGLGLLSLAIARTKR